VEVKGLYFDDRPNLILSYSSAFADQSNKFTSIKKSNSYRSTYYNSNMVDEEAVFLLVDSDDGGLRARELTLVIPKSQLIAKCK